MYIGIGRFKPSKKLILIYKSAGKSYFLYTLKGFKLTLYGTAYKAGIQPILMWLKW